MKNKDIVIIIEKLRKHYPEATCSLNFETPFQILIAVVLSAQCTDERVNKITPSLFRKYGTPEAMCNIDIEELEKIIYSCGFYKNKAKNIKEIAKILVEKYKGKVPSTMEELMSLPGVGRKSANVVMLEAFNNPQGIAIDTHAKRIANRIGLSNSKEPEMIEQDILKLIPNKYYKDVNHLLVWHGRKTCDARKPECKKCPINEYCITYINDKNVAFSSL